jgi:hypothetical protein
MISTIALVHAVFIRYIPKALNTGNKIGAIKNAFSDVVKLRLDIDMTESLFIRYSIVVNIMIAVFKQIRSGVVANGVS